MLGWFADEADPDAGLLSFRRVSDALGTTHWYLKMLRDEGRAADRLARSLARSRYAADLLIRSPDSVSMLGEPGGLEPRSREALTATMRAAASRRDSGADAILAVRAIRRNEVLRIVIADLAGELDVLQVGAALTDLNAATLAVSLEATAEVERRRACRSAATCSSWGWAASAAARWATPRTQTSCSSTAPTRPVTIRPTTPACRPGRRWSSRS